MWKPHPLLRPVVDFLEEIDSTFLLAREQLKERFADSFVHHVGSSSLPPLLFDGSVKIDLYLCPEKVGESKESLETNPVSDTILPVQVQVYSNADEPSHALLFRDSLARDGILMGEFFGMQKQYAHDVGKGYRRALKSFFESWQPEPRAWEEILETPVELESDRLLIASCLASDAPEYALYLQENKKHHSTFGGTSDENKYRAEYWRKYFADSKIAIWNKKELILLFRQKKDRQLIGSCSFYAFSWGDYCSCSIGYHVSSHAQGQGFMQEGVGEALRYVVDVWGVQRVLAYYASDNIPSAKLVKRLGFEVEGMARTFKRLDGIWYDAVTSAFVARD